MRTRWQRVSLRGCERMRGRARAPEGEGRKVGEGSQALLSTPRERQHRALITEGRSLGRLETAGHRAQTGWYWMQVISVQASGGLCFVSCFVVNQPLPYLGTRSIQIPSGETSSFVLSPIPSTVLRVEPGEHFGRHSDWLRNRHAIKSELMGQHERVVGTPGK